MAVFKRAPVFSEFDYPFTCQLLIAFFPRTLSFSLTSIFENHGPTVSFLLREYALLVRSGGPFTVSDTSCRRLPGAVLVFRLRVWRFVQKTTPLLRGEFIKFFRSWHLALSCAQKVLFLLRLKKNKCMGRLGGSVG